MHLQLLPTNDEAKRFISGLKGMMDFCVFEPDCAYIVYKFYGLA